jgi:hypothetical protein
MRFDYGQHDYVTQETAEKLREGAMITKAT